MYGLIEPMIQYLMIFLKAASVAAKLWKADTNGKNVWKKKNKEKLWSNCVQPICLGSVFGGNVPIIQYNMHVVQTQTEWKCTHDSFWFFSFPMRLEKW